MTSQLADEKNEVQRLENEKRDWLSRGVHAEFEKKDKVLKMIFFQSLKYHNLLDQCQSVMWAIAHLPLPEPKDSQLVTSQGWCSLKGDLGVHLLRHRHGSNCLLIIPPVIGFSLCGRHITLSAWFGCLITSLNCNYNHYFKKQFHIGLFFLEWVVCNTSWNSGWCHFSETLHMQGVVFLPNFSGLCPDKTCTLWLSASLQLA